MRTKQATLGREADDIFDRLEKDVNPLHLWWKIYRQIYGTEKRVELLNKIASTPFRALQFFLNDYVALSLCRLLDPRQSCGKENCSLDQLIGKLDDTQHAVLKQKLGTIFAGLELKCEPFKKRRNKVLAHSDLKLALTGKTPPIPSRQQVEDALESLSAFMNTIHVHLYNQPCVYEEPSVLVDGEVLITAMKKVVAYNKSERAGKIERRTWAKTEYGDV